MRERNSVILQTAPGVSAIAVIRLAGPQVADFLSRHFVGRPANGRAVHGKLVDGQRELDDPLLLWDESRQCADICTHGGRWVVHSVLELAQREDFSLVANELPLPGIAVDAADALEREMTAALPMARTREAIATLLNQRKAWRDVQPGLYDQILRDRSLQWLLNPPRIAILGIPNAGKSTLANALFGREQSIVADVPGTTRDYVEEYANLGGLAIRLVDTPGLRKTGDHIEAAAIGVSLGEIASADLRILLLDPTQDHESQRRLADEYPDALLVSGKRDVAAPIADLSISAKSGEGMADLEQAIRRHFGCDPLPHTRPCIWTDRQRTRLSSGKLPFSPDGDSHTDSM